MTSHSWEQIESIFQAAADLPRAEQAKFLDRSCGGDRDLRREVESLLESDRKGGDNITRAVENEAQDLFGLTPIIGSRLGAYRVVREIGRGGMGAVYLAVRDDAQFEKDVAIKLVKRGMDTAEVLRRFHQERQILAGLDHPYIARLIDAGTAADGRPFFVMEYVDGKPVDVFCAEQALGIEARCQLFLRVCEAVAHAHRNLVVHRDLKPVNIFITPDGTPKLLDFGIAKLLSGNGGDRNTSAAMAPYFTPEYASPEQVCRLPVTTSADIYSLGAVLFELLTERPPRDLAGVTHAQLEQRVLEQEVASPASIVPNLDSDLCNIVLMAMRNDPARRYHSVDDFAADIRRYLESRPILARKDSVWYRTAKFARRRRYALAAVSAILVSMIGGTVFALSQAREAKAARDVAILAQKHAEENLAQIVSMSNHSLSDVYGRIEMLPGAMPARKEMLSEMVGFLENVSKAASNDERLRFALVKAYLRLGDLQGGADSPNIMDFEGASKSYRAAEALIGPDAGASKDPEKLEVWADIENKLGQVAGEKGDRAGERKIILDAIRVFEAAPIDVRGSPSKMRATLYVSLSRATVDLPQSLAAANEAVKEARATVAKFPGDASLQLLLSIAATQAGWTHWLMGDPDAAAGPYLESIHLRERIAREHPTDLQFRRDLKLAYEHYASLNSRGDRVNLDRPDVARAYYKKALPLEYLDVADPQNELAKFDYALFLVKMGTVDVPASGLAESLATLRKGAAIFESLTPSEPGIERYQMALLTAYQQIGNRLQAMENYPAALAAYRRSQDVGERALARDKDSKDILIDLLHSEQGVVLTYMQSGDRQGALEHAVGLLARAESMPASGFREAEVAEAHLTLATVYKELHELDQARSAAERSIQHLRPLLTGSKHDLNGKILRAAQAILDEARN